MKKIALIGTVEYDTEKANIHEAFGYGTPDELAKKLADLGELYLREVERSQSTYRTDILGALLRQNKYSVNDLFICSVVTLDTCTGLALQKRGLRTLHPRKR